MISKASFFRSVRLEYLNKFVSSRTQELVVIIVLDVLHQSWEAIQLHDYDDQPIRR